jgi:hypothetical protein
VARRAASQWAAVDRATIACCRDAGGHRDGRVEVVGFEDEPTADGLLHPDERAVRR